MFCIKPESEFFPSASPGRLNTSPIVKSETVLLVGKAVKKMRCFFCCSKITTIQSDFFYQGCIAPCQENLEAHSSRRRPAAAMNQSNTMKLQFRYRDFMMRGSRRRRRYREKVNEDAGSCDCRRVVAGSPYSTSTTSLCLSARRRGSESRAMPPTTALYEAGVVADPSPFVLSPVFRMMTALW